MHFAAFNGHANVVNLLQGTDIDAKDEAHKRTPLILAGSGGPERKIRGCTHADSHQSQLDGDRQG